MEEGPKVMCIDLGLPKHSEKEEQMGRYSPNEDCCTEEKCYAEEPIERTLIPVQAQALLKKIQMVQFKLDALLGPRDVAECGKAAKIPPVKETSLLLQAAHTEMDTLFTRLSRLVEWFI